MTHPQLLRPTATGREMASALSSCKTAFVAVGILSAAVNLLYLTGSFFMLEVYDRVIPSHSVPTLVGLAVIAGLLFAFQGYFDIMRGRLLIRIGSTLDGRLSGRVFGATLVAPLRQGAPPDALQPVRDLEQIRTTLGGSGPGALFDLPWMPLYVGLCYAFHPAIGLAALAGAILLVALMISTELATRRSARAASSAGGQRLAYVDGCRRNAEVIQAMGMRHALAARWHRIDGEFRIQNQRTFDRAALLGGISKVARMALQSGVLGLGAYLVIEQQASSGIIIASSILTSRALAPVELVIANWKGLQGLRASWARLAAMLVHVPDEERRMALPAPSASLDVRNLTAGAPGGQTPIVRDVSFSLQAGQAVGVIGMSASGKSSLVRVLVGAWRAAAGTVRLDGSSLEHWPDADLGPHVGYLPQDVELFAGTIEQNIARFGENPDPLDVIRAAKAAGIHELVQRLPKGYGTEIGPGGAVLSAGQRQRVALARALYRDPFLVVLDEPNSNLDHEGEEALTAAILGVRARGGIVVLVAHRQSALAAVDTVLGMADGRVVTFGPKEEALGVLLRPAGAPTRLRPVSSAGGVA